jgi:S-layer homology domain
MITVASDVFRDVGSSHAFHDDINELYGARITGGCANNPRRFCPDDAVSRGQMAGFLTRGLGRLTWDEGGPRAGTNSVASVTVDAGGLPGGKGYVLVNASVSASTALGADEEAPPSLILFAVENAPSPFYSHEADEVDWDGAFNLFGPPAPIFEGDPADGGFARATGSTSEVFVVPSGESTILDLVVHIERTDPTSNVEIDGKITALYVPFGEDAPITP